MNTNDFNGGKNDLLRHIRKIDNIKIIFRIEYKEIIINKRISANHPERFLKI